MIDSFAHGRSGNLVASIDMRDGRVRRVVAGTGFDMRDIERHPDTAHPFSDLRLPDWDKVVGLCLSAGAAMSGIAIQGWDLALSDRGPLIMEVNSRSDLDLLQIAEGRGLVDAAWRHFMNDQAGQPA
jgi:hypothetical protein